MTPARLARRCADLVTSRLPGSSRRAPDVANLLELCAELVNAAPAFAPTLAEQIFTGYEGVSDSERQAFLAGLARCFAPDLERLDRAVEAFGERRDAATLMELHAASEPRRQQLIRNLNLASDGTARLIRMRSDLSRWRSSTPYAEALDADLAHLLTSWFNAGFLRLEKIAWSSPASLLRKIIAYEAVHEIRSWEELRLRLEPPDRRCYAFFHSRMQN